MATVKFRLAAIERRIRAGHAACGECAGMGPWCMTIEIAGELVRPPAACPRCGARAAGGRVSRVVMDRRGEAGRAREDPI